MNGYLPVGTDEFVRPPEKSHKKVVFATKGYLAVGMYGSCVRQNGLIINALRSVARAVRPYATLSKQKNLQKNLVETQKSRNFAAQIRAALS